MSSLLLREWPHPNYVACVYLCMAIRCINRNRKRSRGFAETKVIDFGGATFDDDKSKTRIINTRQYRGPEVSEAGDASAGLLKII